MGHSSFSGLLVNLERLEGVLNWLGQIVNVIGEISWQDFGDRIEDISDLLCTDSI
jgi:hypothetical protein